VVVAAADSIIEPETVLPTQFHSAVLDCGERRLMINVLFDCLRCITMADEEIKRAERTWLFSSSAERLYDFETICAVLSLDPDSVRDRFLMFGREGIEWMPKRPRDRARDGCRAITKPRFGQCYLCGWAFDAAHDFMVCAPGDNPSCVRRR
jgi:hypothetical protein